LASLLSHKNIFYKIFFCDRGLEKPIGDLRLQPASSARLDDRPAKKMGELAMRWYGNLQIIV